MSRFFTKKALCMGVLFLLFLFGHTTARADPVLINVVITEIGNDVKVSFNVLDLNREAFNNLPQDFVLCLLEDDFFGDELLGTFEFTLDENNVTPNAIGGYESNMIMHTFPNASDAATGLGNDYILELKPVPEPTTLLLLGSGLAGVAIKTRKRLKSRKRTQGSQ